MAVLFRGSARDCLRDEEISFIDETAGKKSPPPAILPPPKAGHYYWGDHAGGGCRECPVGRRLGPEPSWGASYARKVGAERGVTVSPGEPKCYKMREPPMS